MCWKEPAATRPKWMIPGIAAGVIIALALGGIALSKSTSQRAVAPPAFDRVQLTTSGRAEVPVLSPDGREVVYRERLCTADTLPCPARLVIQDIGSGARQPMPESLYRFAPVEWSATGAWLLVFAQSGSEYAQHYVMSHLGGARVAAGDVATFTPSGDTLLSVRDSKLHGARTVMLRSYVAPWAQAVDSVALQVPDRAIFIGPLVPSRDRRRFAATWSLAGQQSGLLTIHDAGGRILSSRTIGNWGPVGKWSSGNLVRPLIARGQGGFERTAVDARSGAMAGIDTILIGPSSAAPVITMSADGKFMALDESHGGEASLSALQATAPGQRLRVTRRLLSDPSLTSAMISPDGATIVYGVTVVAGNLRQRQFHAIPFAGGPARQVTPPLSDAMSQVFSADSRRFIVATGDGRGGTALTAYDVANGRELATSRRPEKILEVFSTSAGPGVLLEHAVVFLDSMLTERRRVAMADSLGGLNGALSSRVRPAAGIIAQPLDLASTFRSDLNFHIPVFVVDTSGRVTRSGEMTSRSAYGYWWLDDGAYWMVGVTGTDARLAVYKSLTGRPSLVGLAPFHDMLDMGLAADGRRGVVVTQPSISDVWLIRNFGQAGRR